MSLFTRDYDYELPADLIADRPAPRREEARMMVLHRDTQTIEHRRFADFPAFLREGDLVVLNDTRVVPARVFSDDGKIELLFLEAVGASLWKCMVRPGRKMRLGDTVTVGGDEGCVIEILPDGERIVQFSGPVDFEKVGRLALPPYMNREADVADAERYQTVFAQAPGAIAAPTAGLHFTPEILEKIPHAFVTLHVGVGTFKPVQAENLAGHPMHSERFVIHENAAAKINGARRVVAVGTTTVRVLESVASGKSKTEHRTPNIEHRTSNDAISTSSVRGSEFDVRCSMSNPSSLARGTLQAREGTTNIFIHPPFDFRVVGALLTNFHLPRSTLLMLVSAFADREFVLRAYAEAVRKRYRFYSYGDCMFIV